MTTVRKRLLIIGAGKWHLPLFEKAREMGLDVYATDLYADAPGFALAHQTACIDVRDVDGTLRFAREHRVDGVITGVDLGVRTAAAVAESLGLSGNSPATAQAVTDKAVMRQKMAELGLDGPASVRVNTLQDALTVARKLGFPVVLKPTDNCGSRGVGVVSTQEELRQAYTAAKNASFSAGVLVEEFMTGQESSVEGFADSTGKLHILGICSKTKSPLPHRFDLQLLYPGSFSEAQSAAIKGYVTRLVEGFGIKGSIVHIELMVTGERVRLIEIASRGCGSYVIGKLIPVISGVDVMRIAIEHALGRSPAVGDGTARAGILKFVLCQPGTVGSISGTEQVRKSPGVIDFGLDLHVGDTVRTAKDTTGRSGYILVAADTTDQATRCIDEALKSLRIELR